MNEPTFTTREEALIAAEAAFLPANAGWDLTMPRVTWQPEIQLLSRIGALPTTMHFGATELDLAKGEVRFVDQDHRDGGDWVIHQQPLPESWLARLRTLER